MIGTNFGIYRPSPTGSTNNSQQQQSAGNFAAVMNTANDDRPQGTQLSDFILQLEDYVPTVPDAVTAHYLNSAGFESSDPRIVRLISVATQKFISDVANDALQHCKTRTNSQQGASGGVGTAGGPKV